jgi:hypothetical protein
MSEVNWSVLVNDDNLVFIRNLDDGSQQSCLANHRPFQQWLRLNKDNLPNDIQAKIDDGTLTIEEAD